MIFISNKFCLTFILSYILSNLFLHTKNNKKVLETSRTFFKYYLAFLKHHPDHHFYLLFLLLEFSF